MKFKATLSVLLVSAAVVGLVGCKKKSPAGPDIVQTTSTVPPRAPLAIATVAPYLGQTINDVLEQALTQGLRATGANRWLKNCPAGGNAKIEIPTNYQVEVGNVVILDHDVVFTDCAMDTNVNALQPLFARLMNLIVRPVHAQAKARIVGKGRLRSKGKWRPPIMSGGRWTYRDEPVRTTGSLDVSQTNCGGGSCPSQIGPIQLDCGINGSVCAGSIGGVGVTQGPPDTPPPPNPTSTTTTTTVPGSAVNVTGIWNVSNSGGGTGGGRVSLSQQGTTVTGSSLDITSGGGVTVVTNSITGTNSNGSISLRQVLVLRASGGGVTITTTMTVQYTLQAASSTRLTGNFSSTFVTSGAPVPQINDSGTSTFTK